MSSIVFSPGGSVVLGDTASVYTNIVSPTAGPSGTVVVPGNIQVDGNAFINGTTTSVSMANSVVIDSYITLNSGNVAPVTEGGLAVCTKSSTAYPLQGDFTPGDSGVSNPTMGSSVASGLTPGDFIMVTDSASNNNVYEVLTHTGGVITVRGIGITNTVEKSSARQFIAETAVGAIAYAAEISIFRAVAGTPTIGQMGVGTNAPIPYSRITTNDGVETLTDKTITATSNNIAANSLKSATGVVTVASAVAPTTGQVLTATSATAAAWATAAAGTVTSVSSGAGLTGGPITTSGSLALQSGIVTAAAYAFPHGITVDTYGRTTTIDTGLLAGATAGQKYFGPADVLTDLGTAALPWSLTRSVTAQLGGQKTLAGGTSIKIVGTAATVADSASVEYFNDDGDNPIRQSLNYNTSNSSEAIGMYYNGSWVSSVPDGETAFQQYKINNEYRVNMARPTAVGEVVDIGSEINRAFTVNANATTTINKLLGQGGTTYSVGTASQLGLTVSGVGTTWLRSMVGGMIVFSTGEYAMITGFTNTASITVNVSRTFTAREYVIYNATTMAAYGLSASATHYVTDVFALARPTGVVSIAATNPSNINRTYTIPNASSNDSFVLATTTQTITNKTLSTVQLGTPFGTFVTTSPTKICGPANNLTLGPHVDYHVSSSTSYPVRQDLNFSNNNNAILFDAYYNGAWRSSHASGNFGLYKVGGEFRIMSSPVVAAASVVTWTNAITITNDGLTTLGVGLQLPTSGGTAATLNHYEELDIFTGRVVTNSNTYNDLVVRFTRTGRNATMYFTSFIIGNLTTNQVTLSDTAGVAFPIRVRSMGRIDQLIRVPDWNNPGLFVTGLCIYNSGFVTITRVDDGPIGNSGGGVIYSFSVTYPC